MLRSSECFLVDSFKSGKGRILKSLLLEKFIFQSNTIPTFNDS